MPEDFALTFDRKRWDNVTLSRTNSTAKSAPTPSKMPWFAGAAVAMAALLLTAPHWMTRSSTAKPSFIKTSRTVWHHETFYAIDMVSQTQGWAFTRAGPGVFRTVSGFDRWKRVGFLPPLGSGIVFTHVFNVRQAAVIMVQQPKAIVTTAVTSNGGGTWQTSRLKVDHVRGILDASSVSWLNARTGVLIIEANLAEKAHRRTGVWLYTSINGGFTWHLMSQLHQGLPGWGSLAMATPSSLWLATGNRLWHSTDMGRHWHLVVLPTPGFADATPISILRAPIFFNRGSYGILPVRWNQNETEVYHTTNGGRTWTLTTPLAHSPQGQFTASNAEDWWVFNMPQAPNVPSSGAIWSTTNSGRTWSLVSVPKPLADLVHQNYWLFSAHFVSATTGLVGFTDSPTAGNPQISDWFITRNGGKTWRSLSTESQFP